jgi:hypothetical protein
MKAKLKVSIAIIIVALLLITALIFYNQYSVQPIECQGKEGPLLQLCLTDLAVNSSDVKLCDKIDDRFQKAICYEYVAQNIGCDLYKDQSLKDTCIRKQHLKEGDVDYCTTAPDKSACFMDIAIAKKDIKYCDDTSNKDLCLVLVAGASGDPASCASSTPEHLENCITNAAINQRNLSVCESLNASMAVSCKVNTAVASNDIKLCDDDDMYVKEPCLAQYAVIRKDPLLCESAGALRNQCYLGLAITSKNKGLCASLPDDMKPECILRAS